MKTLDFKMPDFTRYAWVSDEAHNVWSPRIKHINLAWQNIEWLSVVENVRKCAICIVKINDLSRFNLNLINHGLSLLVLSIQENRSYGARVEKSSIHANSLVRVVVGKIADIKKFMKAWDVSDQNIIGTLLGYPKCCQVFFKNSWEKNELIDTTWAMLGEVEEKRSRTLKCSPENNILLRWLGVRFAPNLPCSYYCKKTNILAKKMIAVGEKYRYGKEIDWAYQMLSWPLNWSALHGIAEIRTPIVKIIANTDATGEKYEINLEGENYPLEGAYGLQKPYIYGKRKKTNTFEKNLAQQTHFLENGFSSESSMNDAHSLIANFVSNNFNGGSILDLGCGNGLLLKEIYRKKPFTPFGIDCSIDKVLIAQNNFVQFKNNFLVESITDKAKIWAKNMIYDIVLLMPGRLLELNEIERAKLICKIAQKTKCIVAYAYSDWIFKFGSFSALLNEAQLTSITTGKYPVAIVKTNLN